MTLHIKTYSSIKNKSSLIAAPIWVMSRCISSWGIRWLHIFFDNLNIVEVICKKHFGKKHLYNIKTSLWDCFNQLMSETDQHFGTTSRLCWEKTVHTYCNNLLCNMKVFFFYFNLILQIYLIFILLCLL